MSQAANNTLSRHAALKAACAIDGWLTPSEAAALYDLARDASGPIIEIGSWQGRSTAALALGSMAGTKQPVYAVDPFIGAQQGAHPTTLGHPADQVVTPQRLRANLDTAGVNGLVQIVPRASHEALADVPTECGLLFVDGAHDFESVCRDLDLYLPRVKSGGVVVLHDVTEADPGVPEAFDSRIMPHLDRWRLRGRVDSAVVIQRADTESRSVMLAFPGHTFAWGPITGVLEASLGRHQVTAVSGGAHGWDDFNFLWCKGLNAFEAGEITHFAMLHSDITPARGWLDILLGELEDRQADLVSAVVPIKDKRGLTSTGIGDVSNQWGAWRRFTMREVVELPETFGLADTTHAGERDRCLLVNSGCWVADLRRPIFREVDEKGNLCAWFDFPTRINRGTDGKWRNERESEDWFFSRKLAGLKANVLATRKVRLDHAGTVHFPNCEAWGSYEGGDLETAKNWRRS